jgi:hypothetical protein
MGDIDSYSLSRCIETIIDRVLTNDVSTFSPAIITKVIKAKNNENVVLCDCKSSFLQVVNDGGVNTKKEKTILNVPLLLPSTTNTFTLRPPLDDASLVGAGVGLIVSDTYLANWRESSGETPVLPTYPRKFNVADAVAILGLTPTKKGFDSPLKDSTAQIKVKQGVKIEIGNDSADLLRILKDLIEIVTNANTPAGTAGGPLIFTPASTGETIASIAAAIETITNTEQ